jgi:hypothetical protein|tara:strand:- start:333 stop:470 length:138 start_codon:yes stop_codon:yes gene_type:complete
MKTYFYWLFLIPLFYFFGSGEYSWIPTIVLLFVVIITIWRGITSG